MAERWKTEGPKLPNKLIMRHKILFFNNFFRFNRFIYYICTTYTSYFS